MRRAIALTLCGVLVGAVVACSSEGSGATSVAAKSGVRLVKVGSFSSPTYLTSPPGDRSRRFVTEQGGKVMLLRGGRTTTFLDLTSRVQSGGERGLLSIAFPPDYKRSGRFYVYYVDKGDALNVDGFSRSKGNPNQADPNSRQNIIKQAHPLPNHNGGQLQFGKDGKLYIGFGDGGGADDPDDNAQNLGVRFGKLMRIVPKPGGGYTVPGDNPFVHKAGALPEIFAYGLRNPYRFSFDRRTGDLTIGDVGQDHVEEVDFLKASKKAKRPRGGVNFGWDRYEGRGRNQGGSSPTAPGHLAPVLQHSHDEGFCSLIGGYVIRDRSLGSLYGKYVYGDNCESHPRVARLTSKTAHGDRRLGPAVPAVSSFGEDAAGHVYVLSLTGPVYRIARR